VLPENAPGSPLVNVKGWQMVVASALAFVLMLPKFGVQSVAYAAASVLAGSLTALLLGKSSKKEEAAAVAASASEILFLLLLMMLSSPQIYY
jgi:hypothetical protein